ncbi:MAG: tetratricopeptide repeat protein [Bryobacteraceae bacterium]
MKILLAIAAMSAVLWPADPLRERLEAGLRAQQAGDLPAAITIYREVLARSPRTTAARHLLGVCELQSGNLAEGLRQLETVRREDPANRQAVYTLVSTYVATGALDEAQRVLGSTLRGDRSAEAHFMRGSYAMARADYAAAIGELQAARRLGPQLPGVRSMLGVTYCFANRLDEAIPMLESALKENPRDGNAAAFLGWLYKERDRSAEATALLKQTVQARPEDKGALFLLAQLTQARGGAAEAVEMLERVVAMDEGHRGAHVLLARLYRQLGRLEDAERERAIVARLQAELQAAQPGAH